MLGEPLLLLVPVLLGSGPPGSTGPAEPRATLSQEIAETPHALCDVTLIDVEAEDPSRARRPGTTIVWRKGRIEAVGPAGEVPIPPGARIVDGAGRWVIPGLFDMHVHLAGQGDAVLTGLVVHGVTSARDMGGDLELLDEALARVRRGELVGPRVARAGYVLESKAWLDRVIQLYEGGGGDAATMRRTRIGLATEDDVLAAVARIVESGADLIKIRNTPHPELFRFLLQEAELAGLRVAGHEPGTVDLLQAVELGLGSIEHAPHLAALGDWDEARWRSVCAAMVEKAVHVTPTSVAMTGRRLTADELEGALRDERRDPRWPLLTASQVESWDASVGERRAEGSSADWKEIDERGLEALRTMHELGVPFLAGTDLGVPFVYPGSSLHEELVSLVEQVGLTPLEALQAATRNAARWLSWERLGAVRAGAEADLVLLDADPLESIENVGRIHTVVARGVPYGPAERQELLEAMTRGE